MDKELKRSIIIDHYQNSSHRKRHEEDEYTKINSNNVSCIDNIDLYLKIENNIIKDLSFEGEACVISISSTSILTNNLIGKTTVEALNIIDNYLKMINEEDYNHEVIKDLIVFDDVSRQPSRIKCATLVATELKKYLNNV